MSSPSVHPVAWRRVLLALLAAAALCACSTPPPSAEVLATRAVLAPSGKLRVGVYPGSPTSLVQAAGGADRGVTVELGRALAQRLGVPYEQVEFARVALVLDALKAGQVDFTVTNASPARAAELRFTPPLLELELGYLVLPASPVQAIGDVNRPGVRVGVSQGSSSQGTLGKQLRAATLVPAPTLKAAAEMLLAGQVDAFATNKGILFEMADGLPGARVLDGRWGVEHLAIALPMGRDAGFEFVRAFADEARRSGLVQDAAARAGLRGVAAPSP